MSDHTSQWLSKCSSVPESPDLYVAKPTITKGLQMMAGDAIVWKLKVMHSFTVPRDADGCAATFIMSLSVCNTAPFKRLVLSIPFTGEQYKTVGCGCQEVLAQATYSGQVLLMTNKMQSTQALCATHFAKWNKDFQHNYFFGGLDYRGHAVRLAKDVRDQCKDPGQELSPQDKYQQNAANVERVLKANAQSIKKEEDNAQQVSARVLGLQREEQKCIASLPMKNNNYEVLVGKLAMEPSQAVASEIKDEAIQMKATLMTSEYNAARLQSARSNKHE